MTIRLMLSALITRFPLGADVVEAAYPGMSTLTLLGASITLVANMGRRVITGPTIEQRLARIEDERSIERLKYRYAGYCDAGYDLSGLCSVFTPGGRWSADGYGDFTGHAQIRDFFVGLSSKVAHVLHYVTSPHIQVASDGRTAEGEFYLLCISTSRVHRDAPGGKRFITVGTYADRFVKIDGRWLFEELRVNVAYAARLAEWGSDADRRSLTCNGPG